MHTTLLPSNKDFETRVSNIQTPYNQEDININQTQATRCAQVFSTNIKVNNCIKEKKYRYFCLKRLGDVRKKTSFCQNILLSLILMLLLIVEWPPEEHDMWLWSVDGIVNPTTALLNPNCTPFILEDSKRLLPTIKIIN